jgi:L-threonylcarbamoyladenylate synthase
LRKREARLIPDDVTRAVEVLRRGGLVALPTETVYGLGADASSELAVRRIFAVKGRPSTHPLIVHVANLDAARAWADAVPAAGEALARAFWPGPLTLVLRRSALASDAVTGGQDTVALRVPAHPLALELLRAFKGGIAAPSANRFGRLSPTTAAHVVEELGSQVDVVLDGGPCEVGIESSIVDVTGPTPRLLRPGGLPREDLEAVLGQPLELVESGGRVRAPGMLASHYAPRAGVWVVDQASLESAVLEAQARGQRLVALVPAGTTLRAGVPSLTVPSEATAFARVLYGRLREADAAADLILVVPPATSGLGLAVRDRLRRAAAPRAD